MARRMGEYEYVNPWSAGQDALLGFLAQRDADRRLEEDRARRAALDAQEQQDREQYREIQREQLRSVDDARKAAAQDRAASTAAEAAAAEREQQQEQETRQMLTELVKPDTPVERKAELAFELGRRKVPPALLTKYLPQEAKPDFRVVGKTLLKDGKPVYTEPDRPPKVERGPSDDPTLPVGVKTYIDTLPSKIDEAGNLYTYDRAQEELSRKSGKLRADHRFLDMSKAMKYAESLFPKPATDPMGQPVPRKPATAAAAPSGVQASSSAASAGAPPEVQQLLQSAPPADYTLSDGSKWRKLPDGSVIKVS